jgi:hypothetical protein
VEKTLYKINLMTVAETSDSTAKASHFKWVSMILFKFKKLIYLKSTVMVTDKK